MAARLQPDELAFFTALASAGSLSAAARELNVSTAAVSKRLSAMEKRLGVGLVRRTTRRMSLTPEGELYLQRAGYGNPLLLASGKHGGQMRLPGCHVHQFQHCECTTTSFTMSDTVQIQRQSDIVEGGQDGQQIERLKYEP